MTIQINVKNEDTREDAIVEVCNCNPDGTDMPGGATHQLKAGEDCTIYVHSGQAARIHEKAAGA